MGNSMTREMLEITYEWCDLSTIGSKDIDDIGDSIS